MKERFIIRYAAISDMGKVRKNNEDNLFLDGKYLVQEELIVPFRKSSSSLGNAAVFAVFDGMGGEEDGEDASRIAAETLKMHFSSLLEKKKNTLSVMQQFINEANKNICDEILRRRKRLGTTLALVVFRQNFLTIANLGDSRIYLFRNKELKQLSEDHTQIQTLIRTGAITSDEAKTHNARNQLTQHLGIFPEEIIIEPHVLLDQAIQDKDQWLVCSDGLTDMLDCDEIQQIFAESESEEEICNTLIGRALENGGLDNVSAIIIRAEKVGIFQVLLKKSTSEGRK